MKKGRPGVLLSIICPPGKTKEISSVIIEETSSLGVRIHEAKRQCLQREWKTVATEYGDIRIKLGLIGGKEAKASPEYEDCRKAAKAYHVPVRKVYEQAIAAHIGNR